MDFGPIDTALRRLTDVEIIPGIVAVAGTSRGMIYEGAFGRRNLTRDQPMTPDSVVWIASMTKAITVTAGMQLVEEGKLSLDLPMREILPELGECRVLAGFGADGMPVLRPAARPITLRHLMTHTAGFAYDKWNGDMVRYLEATNTPDIISCRKAALTTPLLFEPGTRWEYGTNIDFVGRAVETISGQTLGAYLRTHLFDPLGMTDTAFRIEKDQRKRLATVHARGADGTLAPMEFEIPQEPEFEMGGGGLYGTAQDYLTFTRMILNRGRSGDAQVLKPETVDLMARNHIGDLLVPKLTSCVAAASHDLDLYPGMAKKWGLSFLINTERTPEGRSPGSLAWAGLANSYYWIDPARDVAGVIMMQVLPFGDPACLEAFAALERGVYHALETARSAA